MTITVSLNSLGILRSLDVMMTARNDALRSRETEAMLISVNVGVSTVPTVSSGPARQERIVNLIV